MRNILLCAMVSCGVIRAMNCPVPLSPSIQQECTNFCKEIRLQELLRDTEKLQLSMTDKDFLSLIRGFATNIIHLSNILSLLRQGDDNYSPIIRFRYGRELCSFLAGTKNLFVQQGIKERLNKLKQHDLIERFVEIGVL